MLNTKGERELAYIVAIDGIEPIIGSDNCEAALVGGWRIMVRKNTFAPGDLAIYFEIDSHVDTNRPEFAFLAAKHGNIKTQKYTFGGKGLMISQGLLMAPKDFGWEVRQGIKDENKYILVNPAESESIGELQTLSAGDFVTERLGVTYAVVEDNSRKAPSVDKYKRMARRHPKLFALRPMRWLMQHDWGKKALFAIFGRAKDKKSSWPAWVVKTDEERVQNMPWILQDKEEWIATEKIDGTSTTFTMKRGKFKKKDFYVCSRNVVFDKPDKQCFYDTNVYLEMAQKYNVEEVLATLLDKVFVDAEWVTLQGETYGAGIQKREYSCPEHCFMGFNLITSTNGRMNSVAAEQLMKEYRIPWVPILDTHFVLPDTVDELLNIATAESILDHGLREGLVLRSQDGQRSFKAVSNEFLLKYHQ